MPIYSGKKSLVRSDYLLFAQGRVCTSRGSGNPPPTKLKFVIVEVSEAVEPFGADILTQETT